MTFYLEQPTAAMSFSLLHLHIPRLLGEGDNALDFSPGYSRFDSTEEQTFTSWLALVEKNAPEEIRVLEYEHWKNYTAQNTGKLSNYVTMAYRHESLTCQNTRQNIQLFALHENKKNIP